MDSLRKWMRWAVFGVTGERKERVDREIDAASNEVKALRTSLQQVADQPDPLAALVRNMRAARAREIVQRTGGPH